MESYNKVSLLSADKGKIRVNLLERETDPGYEVLYTLDRNLHVTDIEFSDRLKNLHKQLEAAGQLDHSLSTAEVERMKDLRIVKPGTPKM